MARSVLSLEEIDRTQLARVGGKAAQLGELTRLEGVRVPPGFVVPCEAFQGGKLPEAVTQAIMAALDENTAYAVRSSATAEDQPFASFAGLYDSFLAVLGRASVVEHILRCRASLDNQRAASYRPGQALNDVRMAVVVQQMVFPDAAGVLFTADPVSGNRQVAVVEATFGLGEALVAGRVRADVFHVRDDQIVSKQLAQDQPSLTDDQVVRLVRLGRRIEEHFDAPQDIEWCRVDGDFQILQSRPITTLFPIPEGGEGARRVFLSVAHQQMMTDAMRPLGLSLFQRTALRPMHAAGGRLFVEVSAALASPAQRAALLEMMERSDPLFRDALQTIVDRGFIPSGPGEATSREGPAPPEPDLAVVPELIRRNEASLQELERAIAMKSSSEVVDFILEDTEELRRFLIDPESHLAVMAGIEATWWLNERLEEWLGVKNASHALAQSVPNNVTSEMGLALLDVADSVRPHPEVVAFLEQVEEEDFVDRIPGREAREALKAYLARYGMRCVGEIDITNPRWSERPTTLLPALLRNVRAFEPGEAERRFARGREDAERAERDLLERLRALPDGARKAEETKRKIDCLRAFLGYREYPKYAIIRRYFVYKQALRRAGLTDDHFYLTLPELREAFCTGRVDGEVVQRRKAEFRWHQSLTPPRVLTSEGEVLHGRYRRDVPEGALVGLPVSPGRVRGRARVVVDMADADLAPGEILVTRSTDPSWSPVFVSIAGLVTEVGGLMTHGSVIAREYGLPAIVGVEQATRLIRDGQWVHLNATDGTVELG